MERDYKIGPLIGRGHFGVVRTCFHRRTGAWPCVMRASSGLRCGPALSARPAADCRASVCGKDCGQVGDGLRCGARPGRRGEDIAQARSPEHRKGEALQHCSTAFARMPSQSPARQLADVYETPDVLKLVMELATGGEVFDRVLKKGRFTEVEAAVVARQMASALEHMHARGIAHRDLKPENVLYLDEKEDSIIKISDFG